VLVGPQATGKSLFLQLGVVAPIGRADTSPA
jgi:hypothetical protein